MQQPNLDDHCITKHHPKYLDGVLLIYTNLNIIFLVFSMVLIVLPNTFLFSPRKHPSNSLIKPYFCMIALIIKHCQNKRILAGICRISYFGRKIEGRAEMKNYYALFFCLAITLHNLEEALWLPQWSQIGSAFQRPVSSNEFHFAVLIITALAYLISFLT